MTCLNADLHIAQCQHLHVQVGNMASQFEAPDLPAHQHSSAVIVEDCS